MPEAARETWTPFGRAEVIKCDPDRDFYVAWSHITESPNWCGTRAEALAEGCEADRLDRAGRTGSSYFTEPPPGSVMPPPGLWWNADGLIAEHLGFLPRASLAVYATAYLRDRYAEAYAMLERFEDVSRGEHAARIRLALHNRDQARSPRGHGRCGMCRSPEAGRMALAVDGREYQKRLRDRRKRGR